MSTGGHFKLTCSTMFEPPPELHQRFDASLAKIKAGLGREHGMRVAGKDLLSRDKFEVRSPINRDWLLVGEVDAVDEAIARANASEYGLTAGFYGDAEEIDGTLARIEAGVTYVNRPQGATTGAWPGYQPFGGWKGSGTTGKAIGSFYYVQQYLREQSQTVVD